MSVLRISLFGAVRIEHDDRPSSQGVTRSVQALLAYLLLHRHRSHSREVLSGLFWGEHTEDSARGCLSTTLWRLRRVLEPDGIPRGTYLINTTQGEVGFNRASEFWLDVAVLEERAARVLGRADTVVSEGDVRELEEALKLYSGDLLEGNYSDWAIRERERLRALYLNGMVRLMRYHRDRNAYEQSLACGEHILRLDPLREEIQREMMRLYLQNGQRALAKRQYEACREMLAAELDVEPMEETQAVYAQIRAASGDLRKPGTLSQGGQTLQPVLQQLREALRGVEQARAQCERALHLAGRFTETRKRKLTER